MRILSFASATAAVCKGFIILLLIMPPKVKAEEIMVFISFSMPIESIQQWTAASQRLQVPLLLRGLKNNSLKETVSYLRQHFNPIPQNLWIDPERFEKYHIDKAPAVVRVQDNTYDVIYGEQSLDHALEKLGVVHD